MKQSTNEQSMDKDLSLDYTTAKELFKNINAGDISRTLLYNEAALIEHIKDNYEKIISVKINNKEEIEKYTSYPRLYNTLQKYRKQRSEGHPVEILLLKIKTGKLQEADKLYEQRKKELPEIADLIEKCTSKYNFLVSTYGASILRQDNKYVIDTIKKHIPIKTL